MQPKLSGMKVRQWMIQRSSEKRKKDKTVEKALGNRVF